MYHLKNKITFIEDSPILAVKHDSSDTVTFSGTLLKLILAGRQKSVLGKRILVWFLNTFSLNINRAPLKAQDNREEGLSG